MHRYSMTEDPVSLKAVPGLTVVTKSEELISQTAEDPVTFADIKDSGASSLLFAQTRQNETKQREHMRKRSGYKRYLCSITLFWILLRTLDSFSLTKDAHKGKLRLNSSGLKPDKPRFDAANRMITN